MNTIPEELLAPHPVMKAWAKEYQRALDAEKKVLRLDPPKPLEIEDKDDGADLTDFGDVCSILGENFLDDNLLARNLMKIKGRIMKGDFKMIYSPGTHCLAVIPFDGYGYYLSDEQFSGNKYLKKLVVAPDGLTRGFTPTPAYYFGLLPKDVRMHCTFTIPPYKTSFPIPEKSEVDFILSEYARVFNNLRMLFNNRKKAEA